MWLCSSLYAYKKNIFDASLKVILEHVVAGRVQESLCEKGFINSLILFNLVKNLG